MRAPMMEDDLDQLLDEVETKYCGSGASTEGRNQREPSRCKKPVKKACAEDENIDDLIEDILNVHCNEDKKQKTKPASQQSCNISYQIGSKKCCPVYIGGSNITFGIGTNISERACNHLRCTACDFNVVIFDDYAWDQSCDYLFFRNSMPELDKLQTKMIKKKVARAYACQCTWRSVKELMDIRQDQQLRWVCGRHS
ncbi:cilia- and flagella-associated protein 418 [Pelobates fuscus]|uniref:cilia- and flagella-associated protein 418 n=1 Tax=Pelobates fuscus TaxID=191477 RepID=UPI002FE45F28